jgi:hypothetical protein
MRFADEISEIERFDLCETPRAGARPSLSMSAVAVTSTAGTMIGNPTAGPRTTR